MRGRGNLGTSSPLFVIDGAIADASFFSSLDPNSIESISFLKDAASSATVSYTHLVVRLHWPVSQWYRLHSLPNSQMVIGVL